MGKYIIKKLGTGLLSVIVVFTLNFIIIHAAPGSPIQYLMGKEVSNIEFQQALEAKYGLDKPLVVQFGKYLETAIFKGDLGTSIIYNRPVTAMIAEKVGATLLLCLTAAIVSLVLGTAMGIVSARREGGPFDVVSSGVNYVFNAIPSFWLGLLLIIVFATKLGWLPSYGMTTARTHLVGWPHVRDVLLHMVLPPLTLTLVTMPLYFRIAKSSVLQVMNEDYITTLRATGMSEKRIFSRYVFKNAILPTATVFGISMAYLITGVSLIETVFAWPGMGRLVLTAITQRDYPVLMGIYLVMSISIAVVMLITDLVYALLDPRIRLQ